MSTAWIDAFDTQVRLQIVKIFLRDAVIAVFKSAVATINKAALWSLVLLMTTLWAD